MLVNKVTKMHYLFFFFICLSQRPFLCRPHVFCRQESVIAHCLSEEKNKNIFPVLTGKRALPEYSLPIFFQDFDSISWRQIFYWPFHLIFFFLSSILDLFCTETSSEVMDSWFLYQNIDLFSLYTSALALLLVHFFSLSPLAPLMGHPYLDIDLPVKQSLAAWGTRERWGSIHLGILVPNWQCWPLR